MNLLCTSWQHFSKNFALRGNSNSNNYGGGYGNGDTVGERGKGSNPPQEITSKHQGHLVQRHISVKAGVGPRLATLQRSFGSESFWIHMNCTDLSCSPCKARNPSCYHSAQLHTEDMQPFPLQLFVQLLPS